VGISCLRFGKKTPFKSRFLLTFGLKFSSIDENT